MSLSVSLPKAVIAPGMSCTFSAPSFREVTIISSMVVSAWASANSIWPTTDQKSNKTVINKLDGRAIEPIAIRTFAYMIFPLILPQLLLWRHHLDASGCAFYSPPPPGRLAHKKGLVYDVSLPGRPTGYGVGVLSGKHTRKFSNPIGRMTSLRYSGSNAVRSRATNSN